MVSPIDARDYEPVEGSFSQSGISQLQGRAFTTSIKSCNLESHHVINHSSKPIICQHIVMMMYLTKFLGSPVFCISPFCIISPFASYPHCSLPTEFLHV